MFQDGADLAAMAESLSRSTDYLVLRRLVPRPTSMPAFGQETKVGILLDTEKTALDHRKDELIELGMVLRDVEPRLQTLTAFTRFSRAAPARGAPTTGTLPLL